MYIIFKKGFFFQHFPDGGKTQSLPFPRWFLMTQISLQLRVILSQLNKHLLNIRGWKTEMISQPPPSEISLSRWQVREMSLKTAIKHGTRVCDGVQGHKQQRKQLREGSAGRHEQWEGFLGKYALYSRIREEGRRAEVGQEWRPVLPKFNIHTPGLTYDGANEYIFTYINSMCSFSYVLEGKYYHNIKLKISYM